MRERTESEKLFYSLVPGSDWSDDDVDAYDHIDIITPEYTVDVKGIKKLNRWDGSFSPDIHWIEFQNVRGAKGWIYGKANYIAFQIPNEFILIDRELLLNWCRKVIVDRKPKRTKELYKLYNREGRLDIISLVLTEDLLKLPHKKIKYAN